MIPIDNRLLWIRLVQNASCFCPNKIKSVDSQAPQERPRNLALDPCPGTFPRKGKVTEPDQVLSGFQKARPGSVCTHLLSNVR